MMDYILDTVTMAGEMYRLVRVSGAYFGWSIERKRDGQWQEVEHSTFKVPTSSFERPIHEDTLKSLKSRRKIIGMFQRSDGSWHYLAGTDEQKFLGARPYVPPCGRSVSACAQVKKETEYHGPFVLGYPLNTRQTCQCGKISDSRTDDISFPCGKWMEPD